MDSLNVDVGTITTDAGTKMGTQLLVVLGVAVALVVVGALWRWLRRGLKDSNERFAREVAENSDIPF